LAKLSVEQALAKAKSHIKKGELAEAQALYVTILKAFPNNKKAQEGLTALGGGQQSAVEKGPPQAFIDQLINLYNQGQLEVVVEQAQNLTSQHPEAVAVWNILGASAAQIGKLDQAINAFREIIVLNPNQASSHYNLGNALKDQGKLEEAIEAYAMALELKPDYEAAQNNLRVALIHQSELSGSRDSDEIAVSTTDELPNSALENADAHFQQGQVYYIFSKLEEAIASYNKALLSNPNFPAAYFNMGLALYHQGKLEEAIKAYKKSLSLKSDYAEAYGLMGIAFADQGKPEEAIEAYTKSLSLDPDNAEAIENSLVLAIQLLPTIANYGYDFDNNYTHGKPEVVLRPKYQALHLIKAFLEANFSKAHSHNNNFKACDRKLSDILTPKEKVFCNTYSSFIGKLLDANWDEEHASENKIYHLGESHCLSYAHRNITIGGSSFRIAPRMTFGAKAFHFARTGNDSFKAITKAHFVSLPKSSNVFLSYGEIDCRPNEGFLSAAKKQQKTIEQLITQTVLGYVQWFLEQNKGQRHRLYFINVPAPVYDERLSADLNSGVARTVALFNTTLKRYSLQYRFDMLDVFGFTVGSEGFSNGLFHVDNFHLGAKALPEIEQQLS
jgi:tetratricopeptide (TPR) repeat protein